MPPSLDLPEVLSFVSFVGRDSKKGLQRDRCSGNRNLLEWIGVSASMDGTGGASSFFPAD